MFAILYALGMFVADLFKSRSRLEAENLLLRHQLTIVCVPKTSSGFVQLKESPNVRAEC
jgi:hypothetical protein